MGKFGWDLPPGVSMRDIDPPEVPCECCGLGACICPECPYCGDVGNRHCYLFCHGSPEVVSRGLSGKLEFSVDQLIGQADRKIEQLKREITDLEMAIEYMKRDHRDPEYDPRDSDANGPMC